MGFCIAKGRSSWRTSAPIPGFTAVPKRPRLCKNPVSFSAVEGHPLPETSETGSELHLVGSAQETDRRHVDSCALRRGFPYSVVRWATRPSVPTMLIARLRL